MKTAFAGLRFRFFPVLWFIIAGLGLTPAARAGVSLELHFVRFAHGQQYKFFTPLNTNSTAPAAPQGTYFIYSPFYSTLQPTNGSWREMSSIHQWRFHH